MKAVLLIFVVLGAANACTFPPHLWCSSVEIATQCKVYEQCKKSVWTVDMQAPPVSLELYFESLCPDCQGFITSQLFPTFSMIGNIMNITLVPYGNARESQEGNEWKFKCQHGPQECVGNLLETCTIHHLKVIEKTMPFIYCMESSRQLPMDSFKACAAKQKVDTQAILSCYNSSVGNKLEHEMALRTEALKPPHQYVPWIVLNGVHTEKINDEATSDLLGLICKTYTGPKPAKCNTLTPKKSKCLREE